MPSAFIPHLKCQLQEKSRLRSEASALLLDHHSSPWHWGTVPETEPLCPMGGNANQCSRSREEYDVPQKAENRATVWSAVYIWVLIQKNWNRDLKETVALPQRYSYKLRCGNILKVHPQINGERKCGPYTQWKATTWMNLQDKMLDEINQLQKDKCCMIALKWGI